jgi:hypothetical protein
MRLIGDEIKAESSFFRKRVQAVYAANVDEFSEYLNDTVRLHRFCEISCV